MAAILSDSADEESDVDLQAGFVFLCNAVTAGWCQAGRIFASTAGSFQDMSKYIRLESTKLFLYNMDNHVLLGPFRATGRPRLSAHAFPAEVPVAPHDGLRMAVVGDGFVRRGQQSAEEVRELLAQLAAGRAAPVEVRDAWSGDGQTGEPAALEVKRPSHVIKQACIYFSAGFCKKGDACTFAHEGGKADAARDAGATPPPAFKRTLCLFFEKGYCRNEAKCTFAHGPEELVLPHVARLRPVPPPPATDGASAAAAAPPPAGQPFKTKLCLFFGSGQCHRGDACSFAHGEDELPATFRTKLCEDYERTGSCVNKDTCSFAHGMEQLRRRADRQLGAPGLPAFFKTKLCRVFESEGACSRGHNCTYAHGMAELQPRPNFERTELCGEFARTGRCDRGDQCRFAHSIEQLRPPPPGPPVAAASSASGGTAGSAAGTEKEKPTEEEAPARRSFAQEEPAAEPAAGGLKKPSGDGLKGGDRVFGKYGGEWHRAKVHQLCPGGQVEVLWEEEVSRSLLAADDVVRIRDASAGPIKKDDQVVARFADGKWYRATVLEVAAAPSGAAEEGGLLVSVLWQGGASRTPDLPASDVVPVLA